MVVVLPRAVRADEAENLALADREIHVVDGREIAEPAGQAVGDDDGFGVAIERLIDDLPDGPRAARKQGDEGIFDRPGIGLPLQIGGGAGGENPSHIHGNQPVEAFGLFHIGSCDDHAHSRPARAQSIDEIPELPARQRIDAGCGLVENQEIGIMNERAAQSELLPHAAGEFFGWPVGKGRKPRAVQQLLDPPFALFACLSEQPGEELDVLPHAQVGIEILAEPLRHVGDARTDRGARGSIGDLGVENENAALLDLPCSRQDREQRGFSDAVRTDQADEPARRNVGRYAVERRNGAIAMRKIPNDRDPIVAAVHGALSRFFGHATLGSQRT